jgi:hypothetical protein
MGKDDDGARALVKRMGGLVVDGIAYLPMEAAPAEGAAGAGGKTAGGAAGAGRGLPPGNRKARRRAEALAKRAP